MKHQQIISDSFLLTARRIWGTALLSIANYLLAAILGPAGFGLLAIIYLIPGLASIGNPGILEASTRVRLSKDVEDGGDDGLRDSAFSFEVLVALGWVFVVVIYGLVVAPEAQQTLVIVSAPLVLLTTLQRMCHSEIQVRRAFVIQAKVDIIAQTLQAILIVVFAWWWGVLGIVIGMLAALLLEAAMYRSSGILGFKPALRTDILKRMLVVGLPLAGISLLGSATGARVWIERPLIPLFTSLDVLGVYAFGVSVVQIVTKLLNDTAVVYRAHLWKQLGQQGLDGLDWYKGISLPLYVIAALVSLAAATVMALLAPAVNLFMPEYLAIVEVIPWLAIHLALGAVTYVPMFYMTSERVDRQWAVLRARLWSMIVFVGMLVILLGWHDGGLAEAVYALLALQLTYFVALWYRFRKAIPSGVEGAPRLGWALVPVLFLAMQAFGYRFALAEGWIRPTDSITQSILPAAIVIGSSVVFTAAFAVRFGLRPSTVLFHFRSALGSGLSRIRSKR